LAMCILHGCRINEDLSVCFNKFRITYVVKLVTNMTTELRNVLNQEADEPVARALYDHLKDIFTDHAHDVNLSFFLTEADSVLKHHEEHIINTNQESFTIELPVEKYMHLSLANIKEQKAVDYVNGALCHKAALSQHDGSQLPQCHNTGLFTARLPMDVLEDQDQEFFVNLYMANSAVALVVDSLGSHAKDMKVFLDGMADGFLIADSTYTFNSNTLVPASEVSVPGGHQSCYVGVCFPSRDTATRTISADGTSSSADGSIWSIKAYVQTADGKTTENILYVRDPLQAGCLKIIKVKLQPNGSFLTVDLNVGLSVTLDWKEGIIFEPEF
ncbi:MAG: FimB/Mfa2 family fimbrial subunit, partial [Bacteroidaceae bacterium]|nr:FimB/Mfa2 family fimbrial subunit [Bacteroidaceae bacterium]